MATLDILGLGKRSRTSVDIAKRNNEDGTALSQSKKRKDEESEHQKISGVRSHARSRSLHEAATTPCFGHVFEMYKVQSTASLPAWSRMARDILSIPGARDTIGIRRHRLKPSTIRLLIITKAKLRLDRTRERMELLRKPEEAEKMHEMQVLAEAQS
ncbi:hypothetical protein BT69DRAFT_1346693 [Atractiella rhizophila]|nr:hypothetical protein BT69DRAFT_1346693 [Atractiella rhizophila]